MSTATAHRKVPVEEAAAYGLLTALGAYVLYGAIGYGLLVQTNRVGPGMLPAVAGGLLMVVAAVRLVITLRGRPAPHDRGLARVAESFAPGATHHQAQDVDIFGRTAAQRATQLRTVLLALVATLLLVPVVGFLGAFLALSVFISRGVEKRPWVPSVVISLVSVALVYAVFVLFLSVPLPGGLLEIGG